MSDLRFLANMNISPQTVGALITNGWNVVRVSQVLPVNASDRDILEFARQDGRVVITQDLDFSSLLVLAGLNRPSVITLRMTVSDPDAVTERLIEILPVIKDDLAKGCAVTIEDISFRVRSLPIK